VSAGVQLPAIAEAQLLGFVLVLARVGGLFLFAPIFSSRMIPVRAKLIAAGGISVALVPLATADRNLPSSFPQLIPTLMGELTVGLVFALAIALLLAAVQWAAGLLDTAIGFAFAAMVDPFSNSNTAVLGHVYTLFATLVFVAIGGDRLMIMGLARSYELLPVGQLPDAARLGELATRGLVDIFVIGLALAAPVLVALVVADAAFALMARAAPQMNVFFVGLPAKILLGFAVIGVSLPFVADRLQIELEAAVLEGLRALRP
jgi:flagellar biosynthetic protein FliR